MGGEGCGRKVRASARKRGVDLGAGHRAYAAAVVTAGCVGQAGAERRLHLVGGKVQELLTLEAHKVVRLAGASADDADALWQRKQRLQRIDICDV